MTTVNNNAATPMTDLMSTMNSKPVSSDNGSVEADTNKFMTLLVTQLKNQDPMNPLDNAQITSQLAQLSTVTGVNKLNTTLDSLKSSYQSSEAMQATGLIGHGVLVDGNTVNLTDGKSILGVELATPADQVTVVISDPKTGKEVERIDLGPQAPGVVPMAWDGMVEGASKPLANGKYTFRVEASLGGKPLKDATGLAFDSVASVTTSGKDGIKLNLPGKGSVAMADIKQVL